MREQRKNRNRLDNDRTRARVYVHVAKLKKAAKITKKGLAANHFIDASNIVLLVFQIEYKKKKKEIESLLALKTKTIILYHFFALTPTNFSTNEEE